MNAGLTYQEGTPNILPSPRKSCQVSKEHMEISLRGKSSCPDFLSRILWRLKWSILSPSIGRKSWMPKLLFKSQKACWEKCVVRTVACPLPRKLRNNFPSHGWSVLHLSWLLSCKLFFHLWPFHQSANEDTCFGEVVTSSLRRGRSPPVYFTAFKWRWSPAATELDGPAHWEAGMVWSYSVMCLNTHDEVPYRRYKNQLCCSYNRTEWKLST